MGFVFRRIFTTTLRHQRCLSLSQSLMEKEVVDSFALATGLKKKEMKAYMDGNCDPYHMKVIKRGSGTKENPTLIPSAFNGRIVGCICEDNRFVNYMWLEMDCPKRCGCGHWFKLKKVEKFS